MTLTDARLTGAAMVVLLMFTSAASAAPSARVAIVVESSKDPLVWRLRAELASVGLTTALFERSSRPLARALFVIAASVDADAVVYLQRRADAQIWTVDRDRATTRVSDVLPRPSTEDDAVTMRTAELLRARLLLRLPRRPARAKKPEPAPPGHRLWLEASGGASFSPDGDLSSMGFLWLGAGWSTLSWLRLELSGMVPLSPGQIVGPEGRADAHVGMVGAGARLALASDDARWIPSAGIGLSVAFMNLRGYAAVPYTDGDEWLTCALVHGRAGLAVRVWRRLYFQLDGLIGLAVPRPVAAFADRQAASWGRPLVAVSFGLATRI